MQQNNVSFGMALKQDPNMMKRLVNYKTSEIKAYDKMANKLHRYSNRQGIDINFVLPEETQKFGVTLSHKKNPAITSMPEIDKLPETKKEMDGLWGALKSECQRLKTLFKIDQKFTTKE